MTGAYVLVAKIHCRTDIPIGRLGIMRFNTGFYAYTGSAMNSLERRIARHVGISKKKHWHIDYFLEHANITSVYRIESADRLECGLAALIADGIDVIGGFGSSDCKCQGHLFYSKRSRPLHALIRDACETLAGSHRLNWKRMTVRQAQ